MNHATQQSRAPRVAMASLSPMTAAMSRGFARDPPPPSLAEPLLPRSTPPTGHARRRRDDDDDDDASSDSNAVARGAALPLTPPRRDAAFGDVAVSAASDAETDDGFVPWADATPFAYVALVLCVALAAARLGDVRDARSPALLSMALLALAGAMQPLLCASLTKARRAGYLDFYLSSRRAFRAPFAIASVGTATACLASILLGVFVDPEDGASASTLIRVPDRIARALLPGYQTRAPSPFVVASATAFVAFGFECVALLIALGVIIARTRRHRRAGTPPDAKSALNPPNAAGDDDDDDETGRARGGWSPSFDFKRGVRRGETTESVSDAQAELNRYMCDQVSELGREVLRLRRVVARRETVARGVGHARAMAASAATTSQVAAAAAGDATPAEAVTRAAHAAALNLVQAELKATRAGARAPRTRGEPAAGAGFRALGGGDAVETRAGGEGAQGGGGKERGGGGGEGGDIARGGTRTRERGGSGASCTAAAGGRGSTSLPEQKEDLPGAEAGDGRGREDERRVRDGDLVVRARGSDRRSGARGERRESRVDRID